MRPCHGRDPGSKSQDESPGQGAFIFRWRPDILTIAFEQGYFDSPKKLGLSELASMAGIKTSTLTEILRRGQKKILGEYSARRSLLHEDL